MNSPRYNTLIDVYKNEAVPDGFGGYTNAETFIKSIWAQVVTSTGTTARTGYRFESFGISDFKNPVIFTIRGYKNQIEFTENHFIKYKGTKYFIKGIENLNLEGISLNLFCDGK